MDKSQLNSGRFDLETVAALTALCAICVFHCVLGLRIMSIFWKFNGDGVGGAPRSYLLLGWIIGVFYVSIAACCTFPFVNLGLPPPPPPPLPLPLPLPLTLTLTQKNHTNINPDPKYRLPTPSSCDTLRGRE